MPSLMPMADSMPDPISSANLASYDKSADESNKKQSSQSSDPSQMASQGAKFIAENPEMLAL